MIQGRNMICGKKFIKVGVICILLMLICSGCNMKTKKYLIPSTALFAQTNGQDGLVSKIKEMNKDQKFCTDIRKTDDGGVLLVLTEEQKKNMQSQYLKNMKKFADGIKGLGDTIEINKDYTEITYYATFKTFSTLDIGAVMFYLAGYQCLQIPEKGEWSLNVTIINSETNKIVKQIEFPKENLDIVGEDWK
ncbi:hypothetical protein [Anaerosacchariphilus polymeriproducens]|uniref:Uncharacterized protein n=1 Tax=Anaerosacchariphilus polymeriproducens TaxID=1812858 RepID=A0A371AW79_9FIRM|nr:hypothetical protein [Anaerosacchariphilus polymeriproducens]RDU23791.1 hypothetical protein DWV06_08005 [Anaerosacchariphilus polymeriproducens]